MRTFLVHGKIGDNRVKGKFSAGLAQNATQGQITRNLTIRARSKFGDGFSVTSVREV